MCFRWKRKKKLSEIESLNIEFFLRSYYGGDFTEKELAEIAQKFSENFQKRIRVGLLKVAPTFVLFECNLCPEEMKEREKEVRLFLPETSLGDDCRYNVLTETPFEQEKKYLPKKSAVNDRWIYYAFF